MEIFKYIMAILLPPVGVLIHEGLTGHFVINLVLLMFFWLPAAIHAVWVIKTRPAL